MKLAELLTKYNFLSEVTPPPNILVGREEETNLLLESFNKRRFKNTILVGEAGCGKTAIIENLAGLIKDKNIILELSVAQSLSETKYRGEFEQKIVNCLGDICSYNAVGVKKIILFIDEIHTILKAGDTEGAVSLSNILKPYLSKGLITIIGATTRKEYEMTIKRDSAIKRRLSPIFVGVLSEDEIIKILNEFSKGEVSLKMLKYIYKKSLDIEGSSNPDISIEILDRSLARKERLGLSLLNSDIVDSICQSISE